MPEASVIRRVQALSGFIGRKGLSRRFGKFLVKFSGSTRGLPKILSHLRHIGESGTGGVGIKSFDTTRNTKGEGSFLGVF